MKYRKKPIVVEAFQPYKWLGVWPQWAIDAWRKPHDEVGALFGDPHVKISQIAPTEMTVFVVTKEGVLKVDRGNWIIRGIAGELYPCKPDIFAATYDATYDEVTEYTQATHDKAWGHLNTDSVEFASPFDDALRRTAETQARADAVAKGLPDEMKDFTDLFNYHQSLSNRLAAQEAWRKRHPDEHSAQYRIDEETHEQYKEWLEAGQAFVHDQRVDEFSVGLSGASGYASTFDPNDPKPSTSDQITAERLRQIMSVALSAWAGLRNMLDNRPPPQPNVHIHVPTRDGKGEMIDGWRISQEIVDELREYGEEKGTQS